MNIFWGMIKLWIFLGVITKLECFGGRFDKLEGLFLR